MWRRNDKAMREIDVKEIKEAVAKLCVEANIYLPDDLKQAVKEASEQESSELGRKIMCNLCDNFRIAEEKGIPVCQDTGLAVVFVELGQDVHLTGGLLYDAVNEGVKQGYVDGYLRLSVVSDPIERINTGSNTPAVIHTEITAGDKIKITVAPKGFGSENMSGIRMLTPAASRDDIIDAVLEIVKKAGSNPCPPIVVGVGIGGNFEYSAYLAKKALVRPISERNSDEYYAELERDMLKRINELGIGPQGYGGSTTALAVNIEKYATHIAGLPVAVNMGCHVNRHAHAVI